MRMSRIWGSHVDMYEPRTVQERAYIRGTASIYQTDSMVDPVTITDHLVQDDNATQDCIKVDSSS